MHYKYSTNGKTWIKRIEEDSIFGFNRKQRNKYPGWIAELETWEAQGNTVEPYETADEITSRLAKELRESYANRAASALDLIKKNEWHLVSVRKKIVPDRDIWKNVIDKWDDQYVYLQDQIELIDEGKTPGELIDLEPEPVLNGG
jgi:hypothetical protein